MSEIKSKIQAILLNRSQKSVIGWPVEEADFEEVANEIMEIVNKNESISNVSNNVVSVCRNHPEVTSALKATICHKCSKPLVSKAS